MIIGCYCSSLSEIERKDNQRKEFLIFFLHGESGETKKKKINFDVLLFAQFKLSTNCKHGSLTDHYSSIN